MLLLLVFQLAAYLARQLTVGHDRCIELVDGAGDGFAQSAAVEFCRLPIPSQEPLLHLYVVRDGSLGEGGINDLA